MKPVILKGPILQSQQKQLGPAIMRDKMKHLDNSRIEKPQVAKQQAKQQQSDEEDDYSNGSFEQDNGDDNGEDNGEDQLVKLRKALDKEKQKALKHI